jgi:hypothetical protein
MFIDWSQHPGHIHSFSASTSNNPGQEDRLCDLLHAYFIDAQETPTDVPVLNSSFFPSVSHSSKTCKQSNWHKHGQDME